MSFSSCLMCLWAVSLMNLFQVKKRKPKKCILFWKDINLCGEFEFQIWIYQTMLLIVPAISYVSGRCLPPIIIRDSSYYCICVAWELNKSDHWVSGSYPLPCVSKMAVIFYLLNSEEIHFFAPKDCRCNLLSIQIILPLEKTLLQLAWVNLGLINWNIFY